MTRLPLCFLVVDENADSRLLLVKALLRKHPLATVMECPTSEMALTLAKAGAPSAIVAHRTGDHDGPALVREIRRLNRAVPIVLVSGTDRTVEARRVGADAFLSYDEWLRIASVVADAISKRSGEPAPGIVPGEPEAQPT